MYKPTTFQDHIVTRPMTYNIINNEDGTKTLNPAPGEVIQQGTPLNAANLNKMERAIGMLYGLIMSISTSGVKAFGANLQVTPNDGGMSVKVLPGAAVIKAILAETTEDTVLTIDAAESQSRIDRVVIRLHMDTNAVTLEVLKGTASDLPAAPQLVRDENSYDLSLAQVVVPAAATGIAVDQISDDRNDEAVCGAITPHALTMSVLTGMLADAVGQTLGPDSTPTFAGLLMNGPVNMQGNPLVNAIFE